MKRKRSEKMKDMERKGMERRRRGKVKERRFKGRKGE